MESELFAIERAVAIPKPGIEAELLAAIAALPAPWRAYRNDRAKDFRYLLLHPAKGVALVDLLPAKPQDAVGMLDGLLSKNGIAFLQGGPPIVAVAVGIHDLPILPERLDGAFAATRRYGIKRLDWIGAVLPLLLAMPALELHPIEGEWDASPPQVIVPPDPPPHIHAASSPSSTRSAGLRADPSERIEPVIRAEPRTRRPPWPIATGLAGGLLLAGTAFAVLYRFDLIGLAGPNMPKAEIIQPPAPSMVAAPAAAQPAPIVPPAPVESPPHLTPVPQIETTAVPEQEPPSVPATPPAEPPPAVPMLETQLPQNGAVAVPSPPQPAKSRHGRRTVMKSARKNPDFNNGTTAEFAPPASPAIDETVTVDGITYVKGREPHVLAPTPGSVPVPRDRQ